MILLLCYFSNALQVRQPHKELHQLEELQDALPHMHIASTSQGVTLLPFKRPAGAAAAQGAAPAGRAAGCTAPYAHHFPHHRVLHCYFSNALQVRQPHKELHQLEELQDALRQQLRRPGVAQQNVEVGLSKFSDVGAELLVRVSSTHGCVLTLS
jgi:hypothetical protein